MHTIEFEASIKDGIIHIPKKYKDILENKKAKFFVVYDEKKKKSHNKELEEFRKLRANSNNKKIVTLDLATDIDGLIDNEIF